MCVLCFQPDNVVTNACDKINNLLETYMGINDSELGEYSRQKLMVCIAIDAVGAVTNIAR